MKKYNLINNIAGWIIFAIAATTYILTIEPTASFWDCSEFIASSYKLEVGHPPGAPLFMIVGRLFSLFAGDNLAKVPVMINILSALASGFSILFLFWTITHIARRFVIKTEQLSEAQIISIIGAGAVGSLAYTFSDTFWFSAVEGEVYASSALFTAIVFWAILKWEEVADKKYGNRWLILIAYLMGLSIGVHLLNLLTIPAIVFICYFKKFPTTRKGFIITCFLSVGVLGFVMYGVIPWIINFSSYFELLFVNIFRLPYNSGALFYCVLLIGVLVWGILYTHKKQKPVWNTIILGVAMLAIGYSSFAMVIIRSSADTPMDENNPDNVFSLLSYINRDQYGDSPLVYGQYFNAPLQFYEEGKPTYTKINGRYEITDHKVERIFNPEWTTIFPRMYSDQSSPNHKEGYKIWANLKSLDKKPTFADNLFYFFKYQVNYMYVRYFLWNFAGRQNDMQGDKGEASHGNWISGIKGIDNARLGPIDKLPDEWTKNKAKNQYYFLPLLLGIAGMIFLYRRNIKYFWVVLLFFFFTGLAIVLYLNQPPFQPRERDYAYAGSFYAFAIYIGFGVLAIYELLDKYLFKAKSNVINAVITSALCLLLVPAIMGAENWDDHDRSNRFTPRDFAFDYLNSCAPNAILFTNGDNDTFPLWYAQEVEGIRTDIRVINLSYLNTDWYIDQMKRRSYLSAPVPFGLTKEQYINGKRDWVPLQDQIKDYTNVKDIMDFIGSENPKTKITQGNNLLSYSPSKKFRVPVDSSIILKKGIVSPKDAKLIVKNVDFEIKSNYLHKNELMIMDLLANNKWERPVYFAITIGPGNNLNLDEYFQLEGLAYHLVPIKTHNADGQTGRVNTEVMYDNMMNKFKWGNINNPKVYLDENNRRMLMNFRNNFSRLATALLEEGKKDSAIKVLDRSTELMPNNLVPYNYYNVLIANVYYKAGENNKANAMVKIIAGNTYKELDYYLGLERSQQTLVKDEVQRGMYIMQDIVRITEMFKQDALNKEFNDKLQGLAVKYNLN